MGRPHVAAPCSNTAVVDARPDWYADPRSLERCHHCGAPRGGLTMDAPCGHCRTPQRQRYFDGSDWTGHVR